ncbi:MAG: lysophospholipid acyltransferase family protein [Candidatus Firestonebacteria bacterium]
MNLIYHFTRRSAELLFRLFFRIKINGYENIPTTGPFIVLCNHVSMFDPPLLGAFISTRVVGFMARDSLFKNKLFGWYIRRLNAIPINRGTGFRGGYEKVISALEKGLGIIAFPEGTRSVDGEPQRAKAGIGMLVYEAKVPVIPCLIEGAHEALPRGRKLPKLFSPINLNFGGPIEYSDLLARPEAKAVYQAIADRAMEDIIKMKKPAAEEKK